MDAPRIKVLQVVKTLNVGGAERFGLELAFALDKSQFDVRVCAFFEEKNSIEEFWKEKLIAMGVPFFFASQWKGNNATSSYLQGIAQVEQDLSVWNADIYHSHFQLGTVAGLYLRLLKKTKYLIRTAHNHPRTEWEHGMYGYIRYQIFGKLLYHLLVNTEAAVSKAITGEFNQHFWVKLLKKPVRTLYNGISPEILQKAAVDSVTLDKHDGFIIGSVGRIMEQKGYGYLIAAVPQILEVFPTAQIWIIGEGDLRGSLEEDVRQAGLGEHVTFLGKRANVPKLLKQMDVFVLPSLWEGLPTVILESMACGLPVIATDIPGNQELIENGITGWLTPVRNPEALAKTVCSVLKDNESRRMVSQSAYRQLDKFLIPNIARCYEGIYLELVRQGSIR